MVKQDEVFFQLRQRPAVRASEPPRTRGFAAGRHDVAADPAGQPSRGKALSGRRVARRGRRRDRKTYRRPATCSTSPRATIRVCVKPPRSIASSRERRKSGKCVLEGEHVDRDLRGATRRARNADRHAEAALARPAIRALADLHAQRTLVVSESLFAATSSLPASVGICAVVATPRPAQLRFADFCLLVDDVQDPGNIGSMLRSAAAAGVAQVLLSKHCAFAWSPKVLRAGQGAHFRVDIHEDVDLPAWAAAYRASGGEVVATVAAGGTSLFAAPLGKRIALAIGNEGGGTLGRRLRREATQRVTIPMPRRHRIAQRRRRRCRVPVRVRAAARRGESRARRCR